MTRGRLRIYLGAAPGVGKTVAMLAEGARRQERGTDVVVGLVETHERPFTASLVGDLEVLPRRRLAHGDGAIDEMDLDALLARAPQVALVDELAHTNAPGSRHEKRWQDVDELLAAGIDVISTVNIQHLESLNDAVAAITGVRQRETVPDEVVRAADQIELVDMTPEALRRRLAHGNVYRPDRVDAALANYFRPGNLAALRELALLWLADRVDEGVSSYREQHGIQGTWPTRERVLVALTGDDDGGVLLRRGARIAARGAGGELHAVHVARSDGLADTGSAALGQLRRLTEELGGTFHVVSGDDTADAILRLAHGINASQVVVGTSRRPRWLRVLSSGVGSQVVARSGDIDVLMIPGHRVTGALRRGASRQTISRRRRGAGWALGLLGPWLVTLAMRSLPPDALTLNVSLLTLLTVAVALVGGWWPSAVAAVTSSLLLNWYFTPPTGTLTIAQPANAVALVAFVLVAASVAWLVHVNALRARQALEAQAESAALATASQGLLANTGQLSLLMEQVVELTGARSAALLERDPQTLAWQPVETSERWADAEGDEVSRERVDDNHALVLRSASAVPASAVRLLSAFATNAAAILNRRELVARRASERELERDNRARGAILSAVSHDLRTPLSGVKAAVSALRSGVDFGPEDTAELLASIEDSADRLDELIGNLLDMSRIEVGQLAVHPTTTTWQSVAADALRSVADRGRVELAGGLDLAVRADPGLAERVLAHLLDNALRHDPGGTVRVSAVDLGDEVELRVADGGPGVPAAERETIFLPFRRDADSSPHGVGLGLAVSRGLTEAMDGQLVADQTPGGGLTMVVTLPRATAEHELTSDNDHDDETEEG